MVNIATTIIYRGIGVLKSYNLINVLVKKKNATKSPKTLTRIWCSFSSLRHKIMWNIFCCGMHL